MRFIIIIDETISIHSSVEFALKHLGLKIVQAENGYDALNKIDKIREFGGDIALCLSDIDMPIMDGITFVKEFRKCDKSTPLLMLTDESENIKIKEGKKAGASGWLSKPLETDQIVETVKKTML